MNAVDLFVEDYLVVADNIYDTHTYMQRVTEELSLVELSDALREHYEYLTECVAKMMKDSWKFTEFDRMLIMQLTQGWGSRPFDVIAKELKSRQEEENN